MPRIQILTAAEHHDFETPPVFSPTERETFFHVSDSLQELLTTLRSPTNGVCLVLTVGYFRATKRFFAAPCHQADVAYVADKLGYTPDQIDLAAYDAKATANRHRRLTLDYLGFRPFNAQARQDFPAETSGFAEEICPFLGVFSGRYASEKTFHRLFSGILDCHGHGGHSAQHDGGLGKLKGGPKVSQNI